MNLKCIFVLLVVCTMKAHCSSEEIRNSTKFTVDWYKVSFNASENTIVSPLSFRILLSLLYHGTSGDTEHELLENVYLGDKHETAVSQRLNLDTLLQNPSIKLVTRVYVQHGHQLNQHLIAKALQYHSGIEQKDFTKSQQTANEINQFVEENTNGLIKDLVTPDIFDENSRVLLLNTLYFKAEWESTFADYKVGSKPFYGIDGQTYSIDFMNKEELHNLYYSNELKAWSLKMNYVSASNSKFLVILPDETTNINEVKNKLNVQNLNEILTVNSMVQSKIYLPKFEIESKIDGTAELKKLGLNSMFDKSEIEVFENGSKLQVSSAKQKARIVVDTQGTAAAAATYMMMVGSSFMEPVPVLEFHFNRPFIYLIAIADTNEPLFIGHYSQPSEEFLVHH